MSATFRQIEVPAILPLRSAEAVLVRDRMHDRNGVAIRGARYVCPLPNGYGERTQLADFFGFVIATHPGKPPLLVDGETGTCREVDFARIQAEARALAEHRSNA